MLILQALVESYSIYSPQFVVTNPNILSTRKSHKIIMLFRSTAVLAVAASFTGFAFADYIIDPETVPLVQREFWCKTSMTTCPLICQQTEPATTLINECDPVRRPHLKMTFALISFLTYHRKLSPTAVSAATRSAPTSPSTPSRSLISPAWNGATSVSWLVAPTASARRHVARTTLAVPRTPLA